MPGGAEIEAQSLERPMPPPAAPRKMRFALAPDLARPTRALLVEGEHDRTAIEFGDLAINAPLDESAMRPPA